MYSIEIQDGEETIRKQIVELKELRELLQPFVGKNILLTVKPNKERNDENDYKQRR